MKRFSQGFNHLLHGIQRRFLKSVFGPNRRWGLELSGKVLSKQSTKSEEVMEVTSKCDEYNSKSSGSDDGDQFESDGETRRIFSRGMTK